MSRKSSGSAQLIQVGKGVGGRAFAALLAAFLLLLSACSQVNEPAAMPEEVTSEVEPFVLATDILVGASSERGAAKLLDADEVEGDLYLFIDRQDVREVSFYLDDPERLGEPLAFGAETSFDLEQRAGSETALPFDTRALEDGVHTLTAVMLDAEGDEHVSTSTFVVDNSGTTSDALWLSRYASRSQSIPLEGADVSGNAYIYVLGDDIRTVDFQLDGEAVRRENYPFYDFAATADDGTAKAFDADDLSTGDHVVTAKITSSSGSVRTVTGRFEVVGGTDSPPTPPTPSPARGTYALRGDPSFSVSQLSSEERKWYDALWDAINNPEQYPNATSMARSGDVYYYRGDLHDYVLSLMTAFRVTGDLRLLDEVDRVAQIMRGELEDTNRDGFLNWINRYDDDYAGKDTQMPFEMKAHTLVAMVAWALHNNRDLRSPAGYSYGAHADFWKDYLINDFEAKWRERNDEPSGFPFARAHGFHTMHSWMRWHYYMGKLTGRSAYTAEAERMANTFWSYEFEETSSRYGPALVWSRGVISEGSTANYLMPQHYARYIVEEAVDLHFEGFSRYQDEATMEKFANAVADFVTDDSDFSSFARDIGGGVSRAGIRASDASDWSRMAKERFAESGWAYLAAWDDNSSARLNRAATYAYNNVEMVKYGRDPKRVFLPVSLFLDASVN